MSYPVTPKQREFMATNYPTKGKRYCMKALRWKECKVRNVAAMMGLRIDRSSEFFVDFQRRAAASKVGKKRPAQAEVMRQLQASGKLKQSPEMLDRNGKRLVEFCRSRPHPKGMLGKKHSEAVRKIFAEKSRARWRDPKYVLNSESYRQRSSDLMAMRMRTDPRLKYGGYSRGKMGRRPDLDNRFFRSAWEANYARYLEWMKSRGEIHKWDYECDTFWFEKIRRGVRSYTPDFKIWPTEECVPHFVEVKGWMDAKSATKIKRMAIYHPGVKLIVFGERDYKALKQLSGVIPGWEK